MRTQLFRRWNQRTHQTVYISSAQSEAIEECFPLKFEIYFSRIASVWNAAEDGAELQSCGFNYRSEDLIYTTVVRLVRRSDGNGRKFVCTGKWRVRRSISTSIITETPSNGAQAQAQRGPSSCFSSLARCLMWKYCNAVVIDLFHLLHSFSMW